MNVQAISHPLVVLLYLGTAAAAIAVGSSITFARMIRAERAPYQPGRVYRYNDRLFQVLESPRMRQGRYLQALWLPVRRISVGEHTVYVPVRGAREFLLDTDGFEPV